MRKRTAMFGCILVTFLFGVVSLAADDGVTGWWKFDDIKDGKTLESVNGEGYTITGNFKSVKGVLGRGLRFDGLTSYIEKKGGAVPRVLGPVTIEAWVALGAYPLNWSPIVCQQEGNEAGYFFGIDDKGRVCLHAAVGGKWCQLASDEKLKLNRWYHVAGVFKPGSGLSVYIDGDEAGTVQAKGRLRSSAEAAIFMGKYPEKIKPTGGIRENSHMPTDIFFDGIVDEVKIIGRALAVDEIAGEFNKNKPKDTPELPARVLPAGPKGAGPFGAFYTKLKYYDVWDALWRIGDYADVVVRFDEAPYRFVFWHGTSYIPHWVTENGIWYDNEFNETWGHGAVGCAEPMSDKQCRHAHVRIIESSDARVVVHWRYALVDNYYHFARVDKYSGWGDWTDEVYTIYPDGVGVRKITLHSSDPAGPHEWQEGIIVMGPDQRPDTVLEAAALTLANTEGETYTYSWAETAPRRLDKPENACIHLVNTKSKYRPFTIVRPQSEPRFSAYRGEIRRDVCIFPWWNHWPTAQNPSDGRWAMAADRASHSSLTHIKWKEYSRTKETMTKIMLHGMTDQGAGQLADLAKSWSSPPKLTIDGGDFTSSGYDPAQRAYVLTATGGQEDSTLSFELAGSEGSPVVNPAFVVKGWGETGATLEIDGKQIKQGEKFRLGHRKTLESVDLIVWIEKVAIKPLRLSFRRAAN